MLAIDRLSAIAGLQELERAGASPTLPVLVVAANAMRGGLQRCLDAGPESDLPKPNTTAPLRQAMAAVLDHSPAR